jgi:GNAT superfamily N-acetyltransferase
VGHGHNPGTTAMDKLTLRPAAATDSDFAYRVKREAFKDCVEKVWGWDEAEQRQLHERRFRKQDFRIISLAGIDVGIVATVVEPDCLKVNQIFIMPDHQGKGVGRACMQLVVDEALRLGLPVRLRVLKVNPRARAFFRKLGFVRIGHHS